MRLVPLNMFKPSTVLFLLTCFGYRYVDYMFTCFAVLSVINCSVMADRLTLLCVVFFVLLSLSHMVFWVRYGTVSITDLCLPLYYVG